MDHAQNSCCYHEHLSPLSSAHKATSFVFKSQRVTIPKPNDDGVTVDDHDKSLESLEKTLKSMISSIQSSKQATKALGGAIIGLRGSAAYDSLVTDAKTAVKDLQSALRGIVKVNKIVVDATKPEQSDETEEPESGGTEAPDVTESIVPLVRLVEYQNLLIKRFDIGNFI
jgi:hypothetical protein